MAPKRFGRLDPLVMIVDRLGSTGWIGIAQGAFIIDHDQDILHAFAGGAPIEFGEVLSITRLVLEKLVDIFAGSNAIVPPGDRREIKVRDLMAKKGPVQRPLRKRDFEKRFPPAKRRGAPRGLRRNGNDAGGRCQKVAAIDAVSHG